MIKIQTEMAERALQMLCLPKDQPAHLLDIGTGSGLSGDVLSEHGYSWVGIDISPAMLGIFRSLARPDDFASWPFRNVSDMWSDITKQHPSYETNEGVAVEREVDGDLLCGDIGQGLNFRAVRVHGS